MKKIGLYPGSFDPLTKGHMDIIKRALKIFDEVVIAVVKNSSKKLLFSLDERKAIIDEVYKTEKNIICISLDSKLSVELANEINALAIIRGLRAMSDFEYEFQIASINRSQNKQIESVFFAAQDKLTFVSSSMVKEIAQYKGKISKFVDPIVEKILEEKIKSSGT
jgi:pantetheine-phosphate adenylyltransferase